MSADDPHAERRRDERGSDIASRNFATGSREAGPDGPGKKRPLVKLLVAAASLVLLGAGIGAALCLKAPQPVECARCGETFRAWRFSEDERSLLVMREEARWFGPVAAFFDRYGTDRSRWPAVSDLSPEEAEVRFHLTGSLFSLGPRSRFVLGRVRELEASLPPDALVCPSCGKGELEAIPGEDHHLH